MAKAPAKKAPTKTEIYGAIAEATGLTKRDVGAVFDALNDEIARSLGKKGPETFTIPGLCKIVVQKKDAVPAREGVNPFTGETQMFKAKPARKVVKVRPLKKLKDMV